MYMKKTDFGNILFIISSIISFLILWGFPDLDIALFGIKWHRNFIFHSIIIPYFLYKLLISKKENIISFIFNGVIFGAALSIGVHLIIDVFQPKSVHFIIVSTLVRGTMIDDNLWLGLNGISGLIIARKTNDARNENIKDIKRKSKFE